MSLTTTKYVMAKLTKMVMITTLMRTFEWDSLPIGGDNSGLLKHICCCASDLVPVTGQVLMIILSLDSFFRVLRTPPQEDDHHCHLDGATMDGEKSNSAAYSPRVAVSPDKGFPNICSMLPRSEIIIIS